MRLSNSESEAGQLRRITPGGVSSPVRAFKPFPLVIDSGQ